MKKLLKTSALFAFALGMSLSFTSCKDTCYTCTGFDDGMGNSLEDAGTICEGADNGAGGTYTEETLEAEVALYELFGGTCTKN